MGLNRPHVVIIGAGLSGLALAQSLRKQNITYEIFERDDTSEARSQGWAIGLHTVLDELEAHMPHDLPPLAANVSHLLPLKLSPQFLIHAGDHCLGVTAGPNTAVLRANRTRLRQWLSTNVSVKYGKRLVGLDEREHGVTVRFHDGTSASGDLLVGADGINSYVREHLLGRPNSAVLKTAPFAVVIGETSVTGTEFEHQLSLGHSAYLAVSPDRTKSIFAGLKEVSKDGRVGHYYWFFIMADNDVDDPEHWTRTATQTERREKALQETDCFDERLSRIIKQTPIEGIMTDTFSFRYAEILESDLRPGRVTLIGDAAHAMTPFRGEGGVHALLDALRLTDTVTRMSTSDPESILKGINTYQAEMTTRGIEAVKASLGQLRRDDQTNAPWIIWGHSAIPTATEEVKLRDWL